VIGPMSSPVISAIGLLIAVSSFAIVGWTFRRSDSARRRWLSVAPEACFGLMGVGVAVVPWARFVGLAICAIGVMGRLYFSILDVLMRHAGRRAR
jgi:hypothetical protein